MKASRISTSLLAGLCLTVSPWNLAQVPGDLSVRLGECLELSSETDRLACYDRLADSAEPADDVPVVADTRATDAVLVPESRAEPAPEHAAEIISTIAALERYLPNAYEITLENGQTWRQVESKRYPLRIGYAVRVYETKWGEAYRLSAEVLNGFIRVERVN